MPVASSVTFDSPILGAIVGLMAAAAIAAGWRRRINLPRFSAVAAIVGMILLALAAAGPIGKFTADPKIAVMVDLSPSTRGAMFRDPTQLQRRIHELLGDHKFRLLSFAAENQSLDPAGPFTEIPADETIFDPPAADDILLFSDGRFDLPQSAPPTFIAVDPGLEDVSDASVEKLEIRDGILSVTIANTGPDRIATFHGTSGPPTETITSGTIVLTRPMAGDVASVELNPGDLWPENDSLSIRASPPTNSEFWWIGDAAPSAEWRAMPPGQIPDDPTAFLAPAIIVLNNISAADLPATAMDHLMQYVRDLGGSLLILGGDRSFGSGGYLSTPLDSLSPLASAPPSPQTRWILLVDASGSMAGENWSASTTAISRLLPTLPPMDPVQIGQFSDAVRWWTSGKTAAETGAMNLPPPDAMPHGPTNLEPALSQIADQTEASLPTNLMLISDCDARIDNPAALGSAMRQKNIRLFVLAIGSGSGLDAITQIASATGGRVVQDFDPKNWTDSTKNLARAAEPDSLMQSPIKAEFLGPAAGIPISEISIWNRVWLKPDAQLWAKSDAGDALAANWPVGRGSVTAAAFSPDSATIQSLVALVAQKPRDPRLSIHWNTGRTLDVSIDAIDNGKFLNDLSFSFEILPGSIQPIPQTAPGHYELAIPAPRDPAIAVSQDGRIIDRMSIAGRYPPEFDELGNDHAAMSQLAELSGGTVIEPNEHDAIRLHEPMREVDLVSWLAVLGAILVAAAMVEHARRA